MDIRTDDNELETIKVDTESQCIDLPFLAVDYGFTAFDTPDKMLRFLNHLIDKRDMTIDRLRHILRTCADAVGIPLYPFNAD